jgi:hypothetical protein
MDILILTLKNNDVSSLEHSFSVEHNGKSIDLVPGMSNVLVANENKNIYVELYWRWRLIERTKDEMRMLRQGLLHVIPEFRLSILTPSDLGI